MFQQFFVASWEGRDITVRECPAPSHLHRVDTAGMPEDVIIVVGIPLYSEVEAWVG